MIQLVVPGPPVSKGRPRFGRGFAYTPTSTRLAEKKVATIARQHGVKPLEGPLEVTCRFYLPTRRRVDLDNLTKLCQDSLNEIAWHDDSQICISLSEKHYCPENPRTEIIICAVKEPSKFDGLLKKCKKE